MLNSHQRCSDSSIFCINAKTCTFRYLDEFFQANQIQMIINGVLFSWRFLFYPHSHRTLFWSSGWCHWRQWPDISAEREPVGHPWQFKVKKMKDMRERNFLILINWIMEGWCLVHSGREFLGARTLNVPHIWSLSRNTSPTFISATLIYRKFPLHIFLSKIYIALL